MPLVGFNRALVKRGLELINFNTRPVIQKLLKTRGRVTSEDIAFSVAPKINAAGRMSHAAKAFELFDPDLNDDQLDYQVALIDQLNVKRQVEEARTMQQAIHMVENGPSEAVFNGNAIVVFSDQWNVGIVGIVAGRLKERYQKPAFVLTRCGDQIKGSGRSVDNVDLGKWIQYVVSSGAVVSGGGHKAAGGLSMHENQLAGFIELVSNMPQPLPPVQYADLMISLSAIARLGSLHKLEPFGHGNPNPRFWVPNVTIQFFRVIKDIHAAITLTDQTTQLQIMAFNVNHKILVLGCRIDVILSYSNGRYLLVDCRNLASVNEDIW
jgi:single-stranded-DNA-specific exonuclease